MSSLKDPKTLEKASLIQNMLEDMIYILDERQIHSIFRSILDELYITERDIVMSSGPDYSLVSEDKVHELAAIIYMLSGRPITDKKYRFQYEESPNLVKGQEC